MRSKTNYMIKVLINRYHNTAEDALLKAMHPEDAQEISHVPTQSTNLSIATRQPLELLENIHYSWIATTLREIETGKRTLLLSALPDSQKQKVSQLLKQKTISFTQAAVFRNFLLKDLWNRLKLSEDIPLDWTKETLLSCLTHFSKNELVELIDFLGIHDLAEEVRQTVDRKSLKGLYRALSPRKQQFLRVCLQQKDKIVGSRLQFSKSDPDPEEIERTLHRRGIIRLAKALSGQPKELVNHIVYTLDTGRGTLLSQAVLPDEIKGVTPLLAQHVLNLIQFLKRKNPS